MSPIVLSQKETECRGLRVWHFAFKGHVYVFPSGWVWVGVQKPRKRMCILYCMCMIDVCKYLYRVTWYVICQRDLK